MQVPQRAVALQTLSVMAEDMADDYLPAVSRELLPVAVEGMSTGALPPILLRQALSVITTCMKRTALMSSEARKDMKQQLKAAKQLVPALCSVVARDVSSADTKCAPTNNKKSEQGTRKQRCRLPLYPPVLAAADPHAHPACMQPCCEATAQQPLGPA